MSRMVEFKAGDSHFLVEVDEGELRRGAVRGARPSQVIDKASVSFEEAIRRTRPAIEGVVETLKGLTVAPNQVNVEFGLKFSAEGSAIVARAGTEANLRISLQWRPDGR